jgi:hypothetical protein
LQRLLVIKASLKTTTIKILQEIKEIVKGNVFRIAKAIETVATTCRKV